MTFDRDAFEERAAIMEFDGGLSRFEAETLAAKAQGMTRMEAINAATNGSGNSGRGGDRRPMARRPRQNGLPRVQRGEAQAQ